MKRFLVLLASLALALAAAAPAQASFGLHDLGFSFTDAEGTAATQAGSHPDSFSTTFAVNTTKEGGIEIPDEALKDIVGELPPGLLADPGATPTCSAAQFAEGNESACPDATALGYFDLVFGFGEPNSLKVPIYNLDPPPGSVVRLGFRALGVPVVVDGQLNSHPPYNAIATSRNASGVAFFYSGTLVLWGNPASPAHDLQRGPCVSSDDPADTCPVSVPQRPFTLLPRSCTGPLQATIRARSWARQDLWLSYLLESHDASGPQGMTGCDAVPFGPTIDSQPTGSAADSPTGLAFDLDVRDPGLPNPDGIAVSDIKRAVVTLPEGMTVNPSQAEGLATCTQADLARETATSAPGEGCPEASKIGTVEVQTPLLEGRILRGGLYVATPFQNPFNTLIALYMTIKEPERGVNVEVAGKVEPDPKTGQLVSTFDNLPQAPFSHFRLRFREGGRSPLVTPPRCGSYETKALLYPWANPGVPHPAGSSFQITSGPGGGPCPPAGTQPFEPGFAAGSKGNAAGAYSPFSMRLTRRDGDQDLTRFDATLPPGVVARLAGVSRCPDAQIALAKQKTGRAELASPSCPLNSRIGSVSSGAGVGSQLTYVGGTLYLAGPFGGAPLSVVAIVPAVAGPFDVGTVVVRQALQLDPRTARVTADGAHSDPIPHILAGIPLRVRDIQVHVDRSGFTIDPTDCDPFATVAGIWGGGLNPFSSADDAPVTRSAPYQAADCQRLGFSPRLALRLRGGTRRGSFPALRAVYRAQPGQANLSRLALRFPHSAFIEQGHFRTICTRVQFAAKACPKGSVYGRVRAFSPLLDEPLEGPVYLRSSNHNLPDAVFALHGLVDVEVAVRIDSVHGGLRATVTEAPDVPVSRVVVNMRGGQKGLIVNSRNLCLGENRAGAELLAHNAKHSTLRPLVRPDCPGH